MEAGRLTSAHVHGFSYSLGDERFTVEEAATRGRLVSSPDALRGAGFRQHHTCADETNVLDLARRAVASVGPEARKADALVYSVCIPANGNLGSDARFRQSRDVKHLMDFPASHIQSELGIDDALVVGLDQQACTGMLGSLRAAGWILKSEPEVERVLCVTSDRFPPNALYEQSYNLISDGAAACLVTRQPRGYRLRAAHAITNGSLVASSDDQTVGSYFTYIHRVMNETLKRAGVSIGEVAWVVPQNMNTKAWQILARLLPVPIERVVFPTLPEVAHVISGDNVVNLAHLESAGSVKPGELVLLVMAGYGLTWQAVLMERL